MPHRVIGLSTGFTRNYCDLNSGKGFLIFLFLFSLFSYLDLRIAPGSSIFTMIPTPPFGKRCAMVIFRDSTQHILYINLSSASHTHVPI